MPKAKELDKRNPVFAHTDTGVEANHSSTEPSTDHFSNVGHEQQDDELQNTPPPQDPNISGLPPTESTYTWLAGRLDGWKENDDYRTFFERSIGPDPATRSWSDVHDNDYDDNGGIPTATGQPSGAPTYKEDAANRSQKDSFPLGIIVRRI